MDIDAKKRQIIEWIDSGQMTEGQIMDELQSRSRIADNSPDAHEWGLLLSAALQNFDRLEEACRYA